MSDAQVILQDATPVVVEITEPAPVEVTIAPSIVYEGGIPLDSPEFNTAVQDIVSTSVQTASVIHNTVPVTTSIGGVPAGSNLNGKTVAEVLDMLLHPYQAPAFSSFSFGGSLQLEVGDSIVGSKTFSWSVSNPENLQAGSISIIDVTSGDIIATGLANTGSFTYNQTLKSRVSAGSNTWRIAAVNTNGQIFQRDFVVTWQAKKYYGESPISNITDTGIIALRTSSLSNTFTGTYTFQAGDYKYIAYPASLGLATSFKDQSNNLNVPFEAPVTIQLINSFGIVLDYNVYRTTNKLGAAITVLVG